MRPHVLTPLFASVTSIKGVGDKVEKLFARLVPGKAGHVRLVDLLFHLPSGIIDRRDRRRISELPPSGIVTIEAVVGKHKPPPRNQPRLPYRVEVHDDTGRLSLVYFKAFPDHIQRLLPEGETRYISGAVEWFRDEAQMSHPDHVLSAEEFARMPALEPVYPMTAGLSSKVLAKAMLAVRERTPPLPEWQDSAWLRQQHWPSFNAAIAEAHAPQSPEAAQPATAARQRLAFDELLANQLALMLVRQRMKRASGRMLRGTGDLRRKIIDALPYKLTGSQAHAGEEILRDMAQPQRMIRLLQGDVGAGKTVVALLALATAVEAGAQGALMVPTEILARQHLATLTKLGAAAGLRVALLTGREKGRARDEILDALAAGTIDILIGTHALFQDDVGFQNLGLVVIDEQHRFGVHQRLAMQAKAGQTPDLLVMTATPIPRTLALTVYGDMDVSRLTEKPARRLPVDTRAMPLSRIDDVVEGLRRSMEQGVRAYWVCPLVEESEKVDLAAAEDRFAALEKAFPRRVGLIHGRMKGAEKDAVMAAFKAGTLSILVSTTVIEVGVDVPEAAIMVIENAERFGLSQLHQLRGRVGRGSAKSSCVILYQEPLGETAKARLQIMRETEDGFRIAEEDLRLRGAGEMLGTQQSGMPVFRLANLSIHGELLAAARDDASLILERDPALASPRGEALRHLLYLFERDEAIHLLAAG
ncbi:MAG: ATP-dependent DNA helicase RecG [Proteobacteria bacterium]|nr:ATP-dependent DNA helicase RecG [Pseudomonadota bacterium]